jgi:two-component system chemotaxis sensor kinase CheA
MSFDMTQFYPMFFEETQEHLKNMEALLLGLDIAHPDTEQLNAIFRAAHSIKGSSGTFGFTHLAQITHILENLLDRIRKDELLLTAGMINVFLDAGDVLKMLLAHHRDNGVADLNEVEAICTQLKQLTHDAPTHQPNNPISADNAAPIATTINPPPVPLATGIWEVHFNLDQNTADALVTVKNLLAEMAQNCSAELLECVSDQNNPNISSCRISLGSNVDINWVRDLLEFVARSDSIQFQYVNSGSNKTADNPEPTSGLAVTNTTDTAVDLGHSSSIDIPAPASDFQPNPTATDKPVIPKIADATDATIHHPDNPNFKERRKSPRPGNTNGDTSIRVDVNKVDQLINLVGELVITQAMLIQSVQGVDAILFERLFNGLGQLERNTRDLQESVMSIRMMPMSVVFSRFPRVVHDLSQQLEKKVELKTMGESTELDKGLIEQITDPLTHLIRNSLDHGIESPADRLAKGKQPTGTITLKAYQQSGNVVIEVSDDGAGLNRTKILAKARERGIPVHDQMTDTEVWMLIFEAGFSTADQVTEISGRGVGMDVVKRNITGMGGRIEIHSEMDIGTRITVRLPLTLAILDGMSIAVGQETYIIPLGYVIESLQASRDMIKSMSGVERMIQLRGEYLPVIALYELFNIPNSLTRLNEGIMVIIESDGYKAALFVDALVGQHQVVIKSLEANYRKVAGIGGATIMGDGHVALILDVSSLVRMAHVTASDTQYIVQAA